MTSGRSFGSVTVDEERRVALVRGRALVDLARELPGECPRWSPGGRGWVVDEVQAGDLLAYAAHVGVGVTYRTVRGEGG